jgi:DNA-binding response OmpR family regulator
VRAHQGTPTVLVFDVLDTLHTALRIALRQDGGLMAPATGALSIETSLDHLAEAVITMLPPDDEKSFGRELQVLCAAASCSLVVVMPDEFAAQALRSWADEVLVASLLPVELGSMIAELLSLTPPLIAGTDSASVEPARDVVRSERRGHLPPEMQALRVGPFSIDEIAHRAHCDGHELNLTRTEFELLVLFCLHPYQVLTRALILERIWGRWVGDDHVIDVHLSRLRRKVFIASGISALPAVRGVGFRLLELVPGEPESAENEPAPQR